MKLLLVFIALNASLARASAVKANTSVMCISTDQNAVIRSFAFDLYATGFPMAGVGMFSGIFEADAPGLNCHTTRGHITTSIFNQKLQHHATSDCLDDIEFILNVDTDIYKANEIYGGTLLYRIIMPIENSKYKELSVNCHML